MEVLIKYRRHLRAQGYTVNTVRAKVEIVQALSRFAGCLPEQLTSDHAEAYFDRELAPWTRRKYLEHVRAFARWAGIADPTEGMRRPKQPRAIPRPCPEEALAAMLAAADARTRAFIILGAFAGLRSFETAKVEGQDFQETPEGAALVVRGKGGRLDLVPIGQVVVDELRAWRRASRGGPLWAGVSPDVVQLAIKRCGDDVGLHVTSHQLRHRYGTQLYAQSRDLLLVQQLMRHASPMTTAGYAKVADKLAAELVERLPFPRLAAVGDGDGLVGGLPDDDLLPAAGGHGSTAEQPQGTAA